MTGYSDPQLNDSDLELLSAYIDQQLTVDERAALDRRLENEPALQQALDELRATVGLLRDLPPARPPRSFALNPQSVAPRGRWSFPWMQLGSALVAATLLLVFGFVLTRGLGGGGAPAAAPMAAFGPTVAPAAAAATAAPAAMVAPAAEPTAAAAAVAPAAGGAGPTAAAAPTVAPALSAAEAPEATAQPAAALAPAATAAPAAPEAAAQSAQQPTEAPPSIASGSAAGAQPSAQATRGLAAPANDAAGAPNTGNLRQAAGTPTPAAFSAQIATSGSAASDTQALEQQPAPTPQASPGGGQSSTTLIIGALLLIVLGGVLVWLFSRRRI